jgi:hypothetical protein
MSDCAPRPASVRRQTVITQPIAPASPPDYLARGLWRLEREAMGGQTTAAAVLAHLAVLEAELCRLQAPARTSVLEEQNGRDGAIRER